MIPASLFLKSRLDRVMLCPAWLARMLHQYPGFWRGAELTILNERAKSIALAMVTGHSFKRGGQNPPKTG